MDSGSDIGGFTELVVAAAEPTAIDIVRFELRHPQGEALPAFAPGAHLPVRTPAGAIRRYSLCNDPQETHRFEIAVKRDAAGRGGSTSMHDALHTGDRLAVAAPRNEFELHPRAKRFLFIAGGIGITPIMAMMRHLLATDGRGFELHYCARSPAHAAFSAELSTPPYAGRVAFHYDDGDPTRAFDFWPLLEKPAPAHIYCCGPRALMDDVRDMSGHWAMGSVHFESFGVDAALRRLDRPFDVRLARSNTVLNVPANQSILEVLRAHGCAVRSSCEAGSCGSCRTGLLGGDAEHRDFVLGEHERDGAIMVCVSRARSAELVIDL